MVAGNRKNAIMAHGAGKSKRRLGLKREEWALLVSEAARSGETASEFCRRCNLTEHSFYKWRLIFKKEAAANKECPPEGMEPVKAAFVAVRIKSGVDKSQPSEATPDSQDSSVLSTALVLPQAGANNKIISQIILHSSGGLKLEFPSGCAVSELKLITGLISC